MTLAHRIRLYMRTWGTRTIGQVVAAMSKHVTAPQAVRAVESARRYEITRRPKEGTKRTGVIPYGKRVVVTRALLTLARSGELVRIAPGTYRIKKR